MLFRWLPIFNLLLPKCKPGAGAQNTTDVVGCSSIQHTQEAMSNVRVSTFASILQDFTQQHTIGNVKVSGFAICLDPMSQGLWNATEGQLANWPKHDDENVDKH